MVYRFGKLWAAAVAAAGILALAAPQLASAQMFLTAPDFAKGPIEGADPLVGLPIPGATADEYRAHLIWNLRAGLNVAALQCQFSPYMRAVDNYNSILAHHAKEFASAYATMSNYFKRVKGARDGVRAFDDYTTSTYNNFSTLHAQYGFCQTATAITKDALTRPKGDLHILAQQRMRELRGSLTPYTDKLVVYNPYLIPAPVLPTLDPACYDKKDRLKKQCASGSFAKK